MPKITNQSKPPQSVPNQSSFNSSMLNQTVSNQTNHFTDLQSQVTQYLQADFTALISHADLPKPLKQACEYAMMGGGKRVRPLLVACSYLTVVSSLESDDTDSRRLNRHKLSDACRRSMLSVELLHAYSLIHDDLPCMDDDALRRGRATCHIAFDEATALLAGDVLQTLAFEVLTLDQLASTQPAFEEPSNTNPDLDLDSINKADNQLAMQLMTAFAPRARRMVTGQMLDLNAENQTINAINQDQLEAIHHDKTGALIEASVLMGGICAKATEPQLKALNQFSVVIGLAFQVQDDILDVTASTDELGKPAGSDEALDKSTYVKLMGVDKANDYAKTLFDDARDAITQAFGADTALTALADWLWVRKK